MRIAIRKEPNGAIYIDKTALERFDEETLKTPPYNYSFVEVDKEDCSSSDFNDDFTFNIEKYNNRKQSETNFKVILKLTNWFENYFDKQLLQSQWQQNFKVSHDNYFDKDYANIEELKQQAEFVREEIKRLRGTL